MSKITSHPTYPTCKDSPDSQATRFYLLSRAQKSFENLSVLVWISESLGIVHLWPFFMKYLRLYPSIARWWWWFWLGTCTLGGHLYGLNSLGLRGKFVCSDPNLPAVCICSIQSSGGLTMGYRVLFPSPPFLHSTSFASDNTHLR